MVFISFGHDFHDGLLQNVRPWVNELRELASVLN